MSGVEVGDCIEGSGTDLQIIIIVALAGTCFDVMGLSSLKVAISRELPLLCIVHGFCYIPSNPRMTMAT